MRNWLKIKIRVKAYRSIQFNSSDYNESFYCPQIHIIKASGLTRLSLTRQPLMVTVALSIFVYILGQ